MKTSNSSSHSRSSLHQQAAAFLLIVLPSFGLYFAASSGITIAIWLLMALIAAGMILAACIS